MASACAVRLLHVFWIFQNLLASDLHVGNPACWDSTFTFSLCCHPRFGSTGNVQCWMGAFNYEFCCGSSVNAQAISSGQAQDVIKHSACWESGLTEDFCCASSHGDSGYLLCWAASFNYEQCCLTDVSRCRKDVRMHLKALNNVSSSILMAGGILWVDPPVRRWDCAEMRGLPTVGVVSVVDESFRLQACMPSSCQGNQDEHWAFREILLYDLHVYRGAERNLMNAVLQTFLILELHYVTPPRSFMSQLAESLSRSLPSAIFCFVALILARTITVESLSSRSCTGQLSTGSIFGVDTSERSMVVDWFRVIITAVAIASHVIVFTWWREHHWAFCHDRLHPDFPPSNFWFCSVDILGTWTNPCFAVLSGFLGGQAAMSKGGAPGTICLYFLRAYMRQVPHLLSSLSFAGFLVLPFSPTEFLGRRGLPASSHTVLERARDNWLQRGMLVGPDSGKDTITGVFESLWVGNLIVVAPLWLLSGLASQMVTVFAALSLGIAAIVNLKEGTDRYMRQPDELAVGLAFGFATGYTIDTLSRELTKIQLSLLVSIGTVSILLPIFIRLELDIGVSYRQGSTKLYPCVGIGVFVFGLCILFIVAFAANPDTLKTKRPSIASSCVVRALSRLSPGMIANHLPILFAMRFILIHDDPLQIRAASIAAWVSATWTISALMAFLQWRYLESTLLGVYTYLQHRVQTWPAKSSKRADNYT